MELLKSNHSAKRTLQQMPIFEESRMTKQDFSATVSQLTNRFNYEKENLSKKERFMRTLHRYNKFSK